MTKLNRNGAIVGSRSASGFQRLRMTINREVFSTIAHRRCRSSYSHQQGRDQTKPGDDLMMDGIDGGARLVAVSRLRRAPATSSSTSSRPDWLRGGDLCHDPVVTVPGFREVR